MIASVPPGPEIALNKLALSANMKRLAEFVAAVLGSALVADIGARGTYAWTSVNAIAQWVLGLPRPA